MICGAEEARHTVLKIIINTLIPHCFTVNIGSIRSSCSRTACADSCVIQKPGIVSISVQQKSNMTILQVEIFVVFLNDLQSLFDAILRSDIHLDRDKRASTTP